MPYTLDWDNGLEWYADDDSQCFEVDGIEYNSCYGGPVVRSAMFELKEDDEHDDYWDLVSSAYVYRADPGHPRVKQYEAIYNRPLQFRDEPRVA